MMSLSGTYVRARINPDTNSLSFFVRIPAGSVVSFSSSFTSSDRRH